MDIFIFTVVAALMIPVMVILLVRNRRLKALSTKVRTYASCVIAVTLFTMICDVCADEGACYRIFLDVMLAVMALSVLTNSIPRPEVKWRVAISVMVSEVLLSIYYILCFLDVVPFLPVRVWELCASSVLLCNVFFFVYVIWMRVRSVKELMSFCTVWSWLTFAVDVVYMLMAVSVFIIHHIMQESHAAALITFVMMSGLMFAHCLRVISDSAFALLSGHERLIVESMKISLVEASGIQREESSHRDIFERIKSYFETEKPYLNSNLTINDVVLEVFSNKVYISRAITHFTGRNFCQYVNYHRVKHAMDLFRKSPHLKISELWPQCGFNSIVSFNMAFRLFVNESPGEWCRKEKKKLKAR